MKRNVLFRTIICLAGTSVIIPFNLSGGEVKEQKKDSKLKEISWRSGFSDPKYFSKCFLKEFGCYPRKYSENLMQKKEAEIGVPS